MISIDNFNIGDIIKITPIIDVGATYTLYKLCSKANSKSYTGKLIGKKKNKSTIALQCDNNEPFGYDPGIDNNYWEFDDDFIANNLTKGFIVSLSYVESIEVVCQLNNTGASNNDEGGFSLL